MSVFGFVAEIAVEHFRVGELPGVRVGAGILESLSAVGEPAGFGHGIDKVGFGFVGGLVGVRETGFEGGEGGGVFGGEEGEVAVVAGEAVDGVVLGGSGAAGVCLWTGAVLGIGAVSVELGFGDGVGWVVRLGDIGEGGEGWEGEAGFGNGVVWGDGFGGGFLCFLRMAHGSATLCAVH